MNNCRLQTGSYVFIKEVLGNEIASDWMDELDPGGGGRGGRVEGGDLGQLV